MAKPYKLYLSVSFLDRLREKALSEGKTEEWFDKWADENVIVYEVLSS